MRILAGVWAGRALASPAGRVRPTAERVRDVAARMALDALLAVSDPEEATPSPAPRLADLFAGTGAVGLEILSRMLAPGPGQPRPWRQTTLDLVENEGAALHALKSNARALGARRAGRREEARIRVLERDAIPWVEHPRHRPWTLAFADPPWGSAKVDRLLRSWSVRPFARILLLEHAADHALDPGFFRGRRRQERVEDAVLSLFLAPPLPRGEGGAALRT